MSYLTTDILNEHIVSGRMDSTFENSLAKSMRSVNPETKLAFLTSVLSAERAACRALGLRVLRRTVTEHYILDQIVTQCFTLTRYTEIEMWYSAILARYPLMRLAHKLRAEIQARGDSDFQLIHVRALQMCHTSSPVLKRAALTLLNDVEPRAAT